MSLFFTGATAELAVLRLPGTYAPQDDTHLLLRSVLAGELIVGAHVLDLCTGTGRVALGLAAAGAAEVTAVDISRRAVLTTRLNAFLNGLPVRAHRRDLLAGLRGRQFDLIVSNPPYVPSPAGRPGAHSPARSWDAGRDGRALLDRICAEAPAHLAPGGSLWLVHSALSDPDRTLGMLADGGLEAEVAARDSIPFGPVLTARASWLREQGLLAPGQELEELVVIRGHNP